MATNLLAQLRADNPRYAHYDDDQFIDLISSQAGIPRSQLMQRIGGEEQSNTPPTSSPTSVIDKLRADNPRYRHYSDEQWVSLIAENTNSTFEDAASMLGYQPPEPEQISETQEERPSGFTGMLGNVVRGAKQAGRSIGAMGNTITGDLTAVEDYARRSQESAEKEMPEEQRQLHSELQAIDREQGAMGQIGDTLGAAARNPMGTAQLITEQIPNSAVSLGSGWAGFKTGAALGAAAGPVGASIGGALGFLGGMFLGNYMLEGGSKAIEKAEGGFTEDERRETLTEGAKKAGVITAVDAATFKAGSMIANRLGGAAAVKNGAKAEAEVLMKAGVDMSSPATINAALAKSPELMKQAKIAGERAAINTLSRSKKAGIAGTGLSLETVGEGAGEYLGEMAATGEGDVVDATIEALAGFSQSAVQTAYNYNRLGNKLNPENIRRQADEINQARTQEGINNIANAETVDEAIQAAADIAAQKPVTPGDVMDDIAYREELLKRTEAFTQGGVNEETQQETITQPVQAAEVLGAQPKTARDTEIVLPDNTNLPAQWDVIDASQVQATMKEGENQPRDRTRTASESQIAGIANNPNYALVSDSPVMDVGAPVLDNNGAIVAGNGRFEGLSRAYQLGTATQYKERLMADAARKGIDPAVIAGMERPILVRRVTQPIDTRKTAIKSNSGLGLQYSALELAKIDAERMKNLSDIEVSDNGDIVLNAQNIEKLRSALSDYDASELGALVDKDGMLSQEGVRRVKSAILHSAYGDSPTLGIMIESTDNDIRNITGALTKSAAKVAKVRNDIKQGAIREELDITNDLIEAVEKLAELKARSQPVDNYLAQQGLFGENITPESREFIQFLSNNMRSQKKLTEFINSVYDSIGSIDTSTPDIFGDTPIPSKQDVIQHAKQRKDPGQQDGATDSGTAQQSQTRSENQRDPQERSGQSQKDERLIPVSKRGELSTNDSKEVFSRFAELGSDLNTADQAVIDAEEITGLHLGLTVRKTRLDPGVPARFILSERVIEVSDNWNYERWKGAQFIAEEILHAVDSVGDNKTLSASSVRLNLKNGDIALEAKRIHGSNSIYRKFLDYPLGIDYKDLSDTQKQAELFARLGVLYFGEPEKMRQILPIAYGAFNEIFMVSTHPVTREVHRKIWTTTDRNIEVRTRHGSGRQDDVSDRRVVEGRKNSELGRLRESIGAHFKADPRGAKVTFNRSRTDDRLIPLSERNKNDGVNENNVDYNDRQSNSSDRINEGVEEASANQRKSSYNPNNLSLDLGTRNLELDYGEIEQRPGTTEKQRELGRNAYRELLERAAHRGQGSLLGAAIAKDFKEHSGSTLVGRTVQSPEDLAVLAQVLRDPRFETFRIFFTKGDLIVHHTGVTSRLPASSRVHTQLPGETTKQAQERYVASVKQQMKDSGADGYYLLHNHPIGKAEPSVADIKLTEFLNKSVPGFKNHVIIDHNEYGVISMGDNSTTTISEVVQKELTGGYSNNNPSVPHNALRKNVIGPESLAEIGKMIERKDGYFTLIGLGAQLNVVSIAEFPADILNKPDIYLLGALRRFARHSGADSVAAVADNRDDIGKLHDAVFNQVLIDVIDAKTGKGSKGAGGRKLFDIGNSKNRAIQVRQDNSILRSTQTEQTKSLSVKEVKQAVNPLRSRLGNGIKINVVQSTSDIPERVHERSVEDSVPIDTDGVYDPAEKTVYLIADNIPSAERALWVALHETVGHAGLRSLGKDVQQTIAYASKNKFVADLGRAIAKDRQQDYDAIHHNEEAIAELSAALLSDNVDAILERYGIVVPENARKNLESIIERVVEAIRRFAAKVMGKVTDNQIRELVMAAKVAVEGGSIESGKAENDYIKESLRLIRGGYKTVGDFIIPETPEYADNFTGDLAHVPDNDSIPVGPLRVEVGKVISEHRGWGISHLADNAIRDSSRMPRKETGDLAEDLMRDAIVTMNGVNAVHNDGNTYIFVNPSSRKSIVTKFSNGYYSVVSVRPYNNDPVRLWGNSEWRGRLTFPRPGDSASPLSAASHQDNDSPSLDRNGLDSTSRDKFTIPESTEKGQDKKQPTVTTKKRRNIEEPKLSSSPSLSKMLEDYKSIYNEMMSDEFINNNDFDKWVELRERADSIRMEISNKLESGRANGIGIDGDSLLSRNTTDPKNPWRITYLTKDGEPNGHSEYKSAKAAVDDFLTLSRTKKEMVLFSRAQTLANAGVNTTTTQAGKASTTLPEETKFQAFRRKTQDAMLRFKLVQEWLNEQGVNLTEAANVYQRENISKGKTANLIENFRNKELEPLIKDIAEAKFELGDIATYLEARHIPEANARMRQIHNDPNATANGITDQQAQKVLADFQAMPNFKEFEKLAGRVWNIGQETLDMRLNAGLISQEQYDAYKNTYKNWVPLRGNVNPQGFGKGLSTSHKDKRRMGHGFREDEFVLENLVQDRERAIMQVEKNKVSLSVLEFLMQANNPEIGTVGKPQKRATIKDHSYAVEYKGQVVGSFENKGAADSAVLKILNGSSNLQLPGVASILPQDLKVVKTYDPRVVMMARPQLEDNEIQAMINGSSVRMQLNDPLLARAGTAAGIEQVGSIIHAAREFNRFLSKAYTAFNPEFVVTNVMRDLYSGTIVLTGKRGVKFVTQVMQNYFPSIRDLWKARNDPSLSPWVERYRKAGGNVGASWLPDIERIGEDAMKALQEYAGARETYRMVYSEQIANGASKTKAKTIAIAKAGTAKLRAIPVFGKLFRVIERVNAVAENSLRLAAFRTAIENGESDQQAAFLSKETINFNRHGEINNTMSALWLFYNPAAQSIQLTGEALFSSKHKAQVWSLVGALTTLSFLLAEMGRGDDDDDEREYQNIPDHVKDRNLVFKFGDTQFTLAVAYGWGWFHTAGRLLSDYMHGEDGEKIAVKLAASFVENFSPMGNPVDEGDNETQFVPFQLLPTVVKIAVGPSVNLNSMGREIHPRKFSDSQPDSQLASRSVRGTIYQDLADFLNDATGGSKYEPGRISISPDTIKFMVTSITGGAGKFVSDTVTGTMGVTNGVAPTLKDTPIVRRFARESGVEDSRAAFWKAVKEVKSASERYNRALRDGDIFYAQNAIDTKQRIIALAEYANKYSAAAAMERDAILDIQKSEDMTKKEKSLRIKEIEIAERRLYDDFLRMFDVAKKTDE